MPKKSFLADLISFFTTKEFLQDSNKDIKQGLKATFYAVSVSLFLAVITGILSSIITNSVGFSTSDNYTVIDDLSNLPLWQSLSLLILIGPLLEELAFRFLLLPKKNTIIFGFLFFIIYLSQASLGFFPISTELLISIFLIFTVFATFSAIFAAFKLNASKLISFWQSNNLALVYSGSAIFAIMHGLNYTNIINYVYLIPILVLPQFIVGLNMSYLRIKYGFAWCLLAHSLYNAILALGVSELYVGNLLEYTQIALSLAIIVVLSVVIYLIADLFIKLPKADES